MPATGTQICGVSVSMKSDNTFTQISNSESHLVEVFLLLLYFGNVEQQAPHLPSELQGDSLIDPPDQLEGSTRWEVIVTGGPSKRSEPRSPQKHPEPSFQVLLFSILLRFLLLYVKYFELCERCQTNEICSFYYHYSDCNEMFAVCSLSMQHRDAIGGLASGQK